MIDSAFNDDKAYNVSRNVVKDEQVGGGKVEDL